MHRILLSLRGLVAVLLIATATIASGQELYELAVPGRPDLTSRAEILGSQLKVTDATGSTYTYDRHPAFDSPDGALLGYRSLGAGTALRWPVTGAGAMWIGDLAGLGWRKSQQGVTAIGGAPFPGAEGPPLIRGPGGIGFLSGTAGATWAAYIGSDGRLKCFYGTPGKWKSRDVKLPIALIPSAPLVMHDTLGAWPGILTIGSSGRLLLITDGTIVTPLATTLLFPPGTHVEYLHYGAKPHAFAIDVQGRLWDIDLNASSGTMVEPAPGAFPPGAPLAVLMNGTIPVVTAVNQSSVMVAYTRLPGNWSPATVGAGFMPGTHIAAAEMMIGPVPQLHVAAVNWAGQMQLWSKVGAVWSATTVPTLPLTPGSPVEIGPSTFGPILSAIGADGVWHAWTFGPPAVWTDVSIGPGYAMGGPLAMIPGSGTLLTIDALGRLVVASRGTAGWSVSYALPAFDYMPQLLSRRVIPNVELPPAQVTFANPSEDDLIVQIVDQFQPRQPEEIRIKKQSEATRSLARDAGGTLEEVYLVPGPLGTLIERAQRSPIPPQQRYTLVAWSDKVTYRYIDNRKEKPQGALPSFDLKSHVSLGVIPVPPGPLLQDGEMLNLPMIAKQTNNPGAARFFPQPNSPPVTIEKP